MEASQREQAAVADARRDESAPLRESCYVNPNRIEAIKQLPIDRFDYKKLLRLLQELNLVYRSEAYMATAMLIRSITDHVPPLFGVRGFSESREQLLGVKIIQRSDA
jgi:hypothetical protein